MKVSFIKRCVAILGFFLLLASVLPATAQSREWKYRTNIEFTPQDEETLDEAEYLAGAGSLAAARELYLEVANRYPGTAAEAQILRSVYILTKAVDGETAAREVLNSIRQKFPDSVWDYYARMDLAKFEFGRNLDLKYKHYITIASEISGVDLSDAKNGNGASISFRALNFEKRIALEEIFISLFYGFLNTGRYAEALNIAEFAHDALDFDVVTDGSFSSRVIHLLTTTVGEQARDIGTRSSSLSISAFFPEPNSSVGPKPEVSAVVKTGNFRNALLDLATIRVLVNGVDVTNSVATRTSYDSSLSEDADFETTVLSIPTQLGLGSHTVEITANSKTQEGVPGEPTTLSWSFTVRNLPSALELSATKDSTLQHRNPHQNEGASPYLTLEKIQGKATRSAVAFDLSDVNLTGLTSATLRLTVDPSQGVNGWGNGDTISALPLSTGWVEGNGQSFGLKKRDQVAGSGSGVTWFSPVDSDISNDYANSTVQWNGGTTGTPTSPLIVMQNHYTGTVDFDVTNDLLNGQGQNGWLLKKDQENRGSKVTFYSREGAAAAGNADLAPTLILNYGNSTASTNSPGSALLARMGWNSGTLNLKPTNPSSELKNLRQALKDSSTAAFVGDQLLQNATRSNPPLHVATAIAYRVWLG